MISLLTLKRSKREKRLTGHTGNLLNTRKKKEKTQNVDNEYFSQDVEFRKDPDTNNFLSATIFRIATVSKVILISATMFSAITFFAWVLLSLFNFELTNSNSTIEHHNGLTINIDTHEANLKYRPVLHIIL